MITPRVYEALLKKRITELNELNPIYTLSGGIDSSLIFSYLDNPECFCAQVDGNEDYEYAKRLYPDVIRVEFNDVDIEKILFEVQALPNGPHCGMSDFYDYFVYNQFPDRLIIVGEEPRFDNKKNITKYIRKLFFHYRFKRVDSPYMYNENLYSKENVIALATERLPKYITNRQKKVTGHNPIFKERHIDQIDHLRKKYGVFAHDYNEAWKELNLMIWRKINES